MYGPEDREDEREYDDAMSDAMELGAEDYDDGMRYDEMLTAEDYNRYEEEQVFQDLQAGEGREHEDYNDDMNDGLRDYGDTD